MVWPFAVPRVTTLRLLGPAQNGLMKTVDRALPTRRSSARQAASAGLLIGGLTACLAGLPGPAQSQPAAGAAPVVSSLAAAPASAPTFTLQPLHWLAGCWHSELDEPGSGEQWMPAAGGTMLGMSRTLKGGRTVQFEFMQIRESALGVVFIAQPSGQAGTRFAEVEISAAAAVFERHGADFPQRVIYRLLPDGRLAARIEGQRNGEWRSVDFPMRRGACDAPVSAAAPAGR
jgi:hypothetical protein